MFGNSYLLNRWKRINEEKLDFVTFSVRSRSDVFALQYVANDCLTSIVMKTIETVTRC